MMAKSLNLATFVTLAMAASLLGHTTATTYNVGGNAGWTFLLNATAYESWASQYTFTVGDVLVFNFVTQYHTVAQVTKESFDQCNKVNPISEITIGPATVLLSSPGEVYFICTVGEHCQRGGQKLRVNVTTSSSPPASSPPSVAPTPSPTTTPPALGPGGPANPISPTSPPPEASPPSASAAARIGLASIFTIFVSSGVFLLV